MAISNGSDHRDAGRRYEVFTRFLDDPPPVGWDANNSQDPKISELHAHLKRDHSRRAIAAQTDPQQAGRRRSRGSKRSEPNLGAARSIGANLSGDAGKHVARKREIRMVEYIEKLSVESQLHALGHGKPLREVEVAPEELRTAQSVATQIPKLAGLWAISPIAGSCGHDPPVGELLLARVDGRDKGIWIEPLNSTR